MKNWRVFLTVVMLLFLLTPATAAILPAQRDALRQEEREDYYKRWLERDVIYIITPEEQSVFSSLTTPEEKEQFIEQFWRRRDPDPRTSLNEYKEEHYRRIAYANDHFHSGVEGWYTDRGKIYIKFGPPTSIEKNPTGTVYERRITEGGGTTMTYPFEVWYYQYLEGVGNGIEIEFVDSTNTGRYEMAIRPDEKDALFYTTNAGNTLFESLGLDTRALRLRRSEAMRPLGLGDDLVDPGASPFTKLDRLYRLERPIANKFDDLRTLVDTRVRYDTLPFTFRGDWFRASADRAIVNLTLRLDPRQLSFFAIPGTEAKRAEVKLFARTQTLNRVVYEFEDVLSVDVAPDEVGSLEVFLYQYTIPLKTGRYKLSLVLQEEKSGKIGQRGIDGAGSQSRRRRSQHQFHSSCRPYRSGHDRGVSGSFRDGGRIEDLPQHGQCLCSGISHGPLRRDLQPRGRPIDPAPFHRRPGRGDRAPGEGRPEGKPHLHRDRLLRRPGLSGPFLAAARSGYGKLHLPAERQRSNREPEDTPGNRVDRGRRRTLSVHLHSH